MKYIDADKLISEIERRIESWAICGKNSPAGQGKGTCESRVTELSDLLSFIDSLQQEQTPTEYEIAEAHRYAEMIRERDKARIQQEQPEVDLDFQVFAKEMDAVFILPTEVTENTEENPLNWEYAIARHFYGLRNRALEEAARHVYESWMGGTMDDVRRDMDELGKVLNARKEE